MRKWVIGIAMICLGCILAEEVSQTIRPPRPDEELIIAAILQPDHKAITDYYKDQEFIGGVHDQWHATHASFQEMLASGIKEIEANIKQTGNPAMSPGASLSDVEFYEKDCRYLQELKSIQSQGLPNLVDVRRVPAPMKVLRFPPGHILVSGTPGSSLYRSVPVGLGKTSLIATTTEFSTPIYSQDQNYVFVQVRLYYDHYADLWYCLARTHRGWKVVAEGGVASF